LNPLGLGTHWLPGAVTPHLDHRPPQGRRGLGTHWLPGAVTGQTGARRAARRRPAWNRAPARGKAGLEYRAMARPRPPPRPCL